MSIDCSKIGVGWTLLLIALPVTGIASMPTPEELLDRAIQYHDPGGVWNRQALRLELHELRPNGNQDRRTVIEVDPGRDFVSLQRTRQEATTLLTSKAGHCSMQQLGSRAETPTAEQVSKACEGFPRLRNYYLFLWGLPMKLSDPGTRLETVEDVGDSWRLRVTYDPEVGTDIWYLDFDKQSGAMVGYSFFIDTEEVQGERILLEGEVEGAGLRLPKSRTWIELPGEENLGTDVLQALSSGAN